MGSVDYEKIRNRELLRLRLGLDAARGLQQNAPHKEILVFLHFPPLWGDFINEPFLATMEEYGVKRVFFGHIHGNYTAQKEQRHGNLTLSLIASDFLDFIPHIIRP